jgi:hypothetical protein
MIPLQHYRYLKPSDDFHLILGINLLSTMTPTPPYFLSLSFYLSNNVTSRFNTLQVIVILQLCGKIVWIFFKI